MSLLKFGGLNMPKVDDEEETEDEEDLEDLDKESEDSLGSDDDEI